MKKAMVSLILLGVMLPGCGHVDETVVDETVYEGIIDDLELQKDKLYTAAVRNDYYTMTVNGGKYQITKSEWDTLEIGMRVRYVDLGNKIAKLKEQ